MNGVTSNCYLLECSVGSCGNEERRVGYSGTRVHVEARERRREPPIAILPVVAGLVMRIDWILGNLRFPCSS
jgi:hypothetical protein